MEIISEPVYVEEQQTRYDVGFVGDVFSFVFKDNTQDTITFENYGTSMQAELYNPRETIFIFFDNVLWMRKTPQTIRRRLQSPVPETPTPAIT